MDFNDTVATGSCELRPLIGLTRGLPATDIEQLTVNAIRLHRQLLARADQLFQALPRDYQVGNAVGGAQHLEYVEAMIEMHAQMNALSMLTNLLGFIPKVAAN